MTDKKPEVTCIGLALIDVIAPVDESFIKENNIAKYGSTMLRAPAIGTMLRQLDNPQLYPAGCIANTACGLATYGIKTRFFGKTGADTYADLFKNDFRNYGVECCTVENPSQMTSMCLTLITPDKDRSFVLCPDTAGWTMSSSDLPDITTANSEYHYIYMDTNLTKMSKTENSNLLKTATEKYKSDNLKIIINLIDHQIIKDEHACLHSAIENGHFEFIIGNISEAHMIFNTKTKESLFTKIEATKRNFVITHGSEGVHLFKEGVRTDVEARTVHDGQIINKIGAGDQFAAGFIAGLVEGLDEKQACQEGIAAATNIIQQRDGRPRQRYSERK